jgi:hypothetical protein
MTDRPIEELVAGHKFRQSVLDRCDGELGGAPVWHGWVIMDAFLAGINYARESLTRDDIESPHPDGRS